MEYPKIREWELAVDRAETSPLANLPESAPAGTKTTAEGTDGVVRSWIAVEVVNGNPGGRWAYWAPQVDRSGRHVLGHHPEYKAIADKIFNGDVSHFIGMLAAPYVRGNSPQICWVLTDPKPTGPRIEYVVEPPLPSRAERYERSKEVYDVETGETRTI